MSWFTLALGLIREAATTEVGQEILSDMRPGTRREETRAPAEPVDAWRQAVEQRLRVADRNAEALVRMLNAQNDALLRIQKRQRVWNICLAATVLIMAGALLWVWLR